MATIEQARSYHVARGTGEEWENLDTVTAKALLSDAEDYVRSFPIRSDLTVDEQRILDGLVCRLALIFHTNPPQFAAAATIKKQVKEGAGIGKLEVEYNAPSSDQYPYVTTLINRLLVKRSSELGGMSFARLVR